MRGYRVCLSTHSPQVLDAIWALRHLKANGTSANAILDIFDAPHTQSMRRLADSVIEKELRVFYFDRESGKATDISQLDPSAEEDGKSGWGRAFRIQRQSQQSSGAVCGKFTAGASQVSFKRRSGRHTIWRTRGGPDYKPCGPKTDRMCFLEYSPPVGRHSMWIMRSNNTAECKPLGLCHRLSPRELAEGFLSSDRVEVHKLPTNR